MIPLGGAPSPVFPPRDAALVKAIACAVVYETKRPLRRQALADVADRACTTWATPMRRRTVWRILDANVIKPWRYTEWSVPRDPPCAEKAGVMLDLYGGGWPGDALDANDSILSADEKTRRQARRRCHPSLGPAPGRQRRVEHEYDRGGARPYLAAWDVQRGVVIGRCEAHTGIAPLSRLVTQVMAQAPYRSANRGWWVVDTGSSHRGQAAVRRLLKASSTTCLVHTPVHASWLHQVEISCSIVPRKVLTPNDFASLEAVEQRLRFYEALSNHQPRPCAWQFTRVKLEECLKRLEAHGARLNQDQAAQELLDTDQGELLAA